jgi:heme transport system ATP-binding protein
MAELRSVRYRAGDALILDSVSARFRENRFNVVLGPNGAGKSTVMKIATGLLAPTEGEVRYGDESLASFTAEELARRRAVLSQHVELVFPLPAEDVVLMGRYPHYRRAPSPRDREIVSRAIELVGMTAKRAQPYPTLSSGEQQKIQLARVLAQIWNYDEPREHKYLFLDEPTATLDIHYQIHLLDVARELIRHNCTVVAILHDLNLALQYGDAFFVLDGGRLVAEVEGAEEISRDLIERVFRVRAHRLADPESGQNVWRFAL